MNRRALVVWLLAIMLAGVFGYAGSLKVRDPAAFATDIENFQLVTSGPSALLAVYLPWLELLLAAGLLLPRWRRPSALLSCMLLAVFTFAVVAAMVRGLDINCGCFGHAASPLHWALIRDVALLLLALAVLKLSNTPAKSHGLD
jgi:uncharacterized membrane protein YphA (DoxX/SURF4 family)